MLDIIICVILIIVAIFMLFIMAKLHKIEGCVHSLSEVVDENNTILKSISEKVKWMTANRELLDPIEMSNYAAGINNSIKEMIDNEMYEHIGQVKESVEKILEVFKKNNPNVEISFIVRPNEDDYDDD